MPDLVTYEMEEKFESMFPKGMDDEQFEELRISITNKMSELDYLQHIHRRETGKNWKPFV